VLRDAGSHGAHQRGLRRVARQRDAARVHGGGGVRGRGGVPSVRQPQRQARQQRRGRAARAVQRLRSYINPLLTPRVQVVPSQCCGMRQPAAWKRHTIWPQREVPIVLSNKLPRPGYPITHFCILLLMNRKKAPEQALWITAPKQASRFTKMAHSTCL
jgi:hypothetical protein